MIDSILDNDLYKFTMQQAVVQLYPNTQASYEFINRHPADRFNGKFLAELRRAVGEMSALRLDPPQREFLQQQCPYLKPAYLDYLAEYRFDPGEIALRLDEQGGLSIGVAGPWRRTILWEVPLLAMVSELHGRLVDTNWTEQGQAEQIRAKSEVLRQAGCRFADFGTRRRRSRTVQDLIVGQLRDNPGFLGTSNVQLALRHGVPPIGTMAHEWIMAHSVLAGLRHANRFALDAWYGVYRGQLGIALTDTYTTEVFLRDFDSQQAKLYDGVRQDSGCPFEFADRLVEHYKGLGIDPAGKTIVFSDALTAEKAARLQDYCGGRIRCAFGIGTNLTNDFAGSAALNIVIKLAALDGRAVVKLTDERAKASGRPQAIRAAKRTLFGTSPRGGPNAGR